MVDRVLEQIGHILRQHISFRANTKDTKDKRKGREETRLPFASFAASVFDRSFPS
jgi:hypothetical protein